MIASSRPRARFARPSRSWRCQPIASIAFEGSASGTNAGKGSPRSRRAHPLVAVIAGRCCRAQPLPSKALGQKRHLLVHFPRGYETTTADYPLVVLLDGGDRKRYSGETPLYTRTKAVPAALEAEGLPPMIVVGIKNRNRVRDLTPTESSDVHAGGDGSLVFMRFLEAEAVPYVEERCSGTSRSCRRRRPAPTPARPGPRMDLRLPAGVA